MIPEGRSPQVIVGSGTSQPQPRYHPALAFIFHPHTQPHTHTHTQQKRRVPHPSRPHRDGWERTPFPRPLLQLLASNIPSICHPARSRRICVCSSSTPAPTQIFLVARTQRDSEILSIAKTSTQA